MSAVRMNLVALTVRPQPVYMELAELPYPDTMCATVVRMPGYTLLQVQPGAPTPGLISDIAAQIRPEEAPAWLGPFGWRETADLSAIRADPVRALGERIALIPALPHYVPAQLRAPWGRYA